MSSFFIQLLLGSRIISHPFGGYEDVQNSLYEGHITCFHEVVRIANENIQRTRVKAQRMIQKLSLTSPDRFKYSLFSTGRKAHHEFPLCKAGVTAITHVFLFQYMSCIFLLLSCFQAVSSSGYFQSVSVSPVFRFPSLHLRTLWGIFVIICCIPLGLFVYVSVLFFPRLYFSEGRTGVLLIRIVHTSGTDCDLQ